MTDIRIALSYLVPILTYTFATIGSLILLAGLYDYFIQDKKQIGKKLILWWLYGGIFILVCWIILGGICIIYPTKSNITIHS